MSATVAIIHTQFGPYHFARTQAFEKVYPGSVRLIQLASQEAQREWIVDHAKSEIITITEGILEKIAATAIAKRLIASLTEINPSVVVIAGYSHPAMRAATHWARHYQAATILLSDSQHLDRIRNPLKEIIKGWWIRRNFDAAFVAGASAAFYLRSLGFPANRIWRCYDVVDNNYFAQEAEKIRKITTDVRKNLGLPDHYFLYVGRISAEKNLLKLLAAYQLYLQQTVEQAWSLVIVGNGSEETELKAKATKLNLTKNIIWSGFKQVDELPQYYGLASALILPSISEPWGLVVNEAMACGLPILISDRCGCVPDLVFPGINGYIFDPFNIKDIADAMTYMSTIPNEQREKMKQASQTIIANYTPEIWADALMDCIQCLGK